MMVLLQDYPKFSLLMYRNVMGSDSRIRFRYHEIVLCRLTVISWGVVECTAVEAAVEDRASVDVDLGETASRIMS